MELKVLVDESGRSPSVSEGNNPDEKEISDDEDDDRNHKHRRKNDARSQSQDRDAAEQLFTKPYKRANKSFENGHIYRGSGSQSSETSRNSGFNPMDSKFDKRRPGFTQSSQGPLDLNQRIRGNSGLIRGRGRDPGHWSQQGPLPPGPFGSNAYGASWGPYGLVPRMANGGFDTLHPLALQGAYRSINPCMNVGLGVVRQRCIDFDEQGFCLRGDMCPMEHGVNRIVVEDVQSLSQFNLPVSLQNGNMPGASNGSGRLPASGAQTNSMFSSKAQHGKSSKHGVGGNEQSLTNDVGADFYDPDQPLWGNNSQTSPAPQLLTQSSVKENGPLMDPGPSSDSRDGLLDDTVNMAKNRMKKNMVSKQSISTILQKDTSERRDPPINAQVAPGPTKTSFLNIQSGNKKSVSKPSQKAQCTLFVNNVPLQQNKKESLISHFHKFGEVIDIYIPVNTERAFVQFSKREDAEAALMAPDAVMGNRFIKLWWANRDNVPVKETSSVPVSSASQKDTITPPVSDQPKPVIINTPKVPTPSQKNLEILKEELRKKQEMLDQKRNDFRRKLDKLAKQAPSLKGEIEPEQVAKRRKIGNGDPETISPSTGAEIIGNGVPQSSKSTAVDALPKPPVVKSSLRPLVLIGSPGVTNPFKLDNRPTSFKISTLPNDLANVAVLKDHFSSFGELAEVELNNLEPADDNNDPETAKYSARVNFKTRHAAEKAFLSGKCLNGHNMQFSWLKSSNRESPVSSCKRNSDTFIGPVVETAKTDFHKPAIYKDEESEILEQKDINQKQKEPDESNHDT